MSVEMLQETRRKRLQKFFELAESTTAALTQKPVEKMRITIGKINGPDIINKVCINVHIYYYIIYNIIY